MLGVPTLLWRDRYEHSLGIGANVLVGRYDRNIIATFLADPDTYRTERSIPEIEPSRQVLTVLLEALESRRVLK
jgi:hypothetical protein